MDGLFGTRAVLQTDIDLVLQIAVIAIVVLAYFYRGTPSKVKKHGVMLAAATVLQAVTFFIFMEPVFFTYLGIFLGSTEPYVVAFLIHGVTGAVTLVIALALVISWATRPHNIAPCYKRKRIMDATLALWIASAAFGVAGYIFAYVLPL